MSKTKAAPIYGNWKMLAPDGELMCRCDDRRARWYVSRGLADEELGDSAFRLRFAPGGRGDAGVAYLLEAKANLCVVCGSSEGLNRHHVVPYQYRKRMPLSWKSRSSYDVVPICVEHHHEYEEKAQAFAAEIAAERGAPLGAPSKLAPDLARLRKDLMRARALIHASSGGIQIPEARRAELRAALRGRLGGEPTAESLRSFVEGVDLPKAIAGASSAKAVVDAVLAEGGEGALGEFVKRWRRHFVESMRPRHLSPSWDVDYLRAT